MGFEQTLSNLFPTGWLDPYGSMPLNKEYSVQIDITQVETDDGIKVTAVKTPPRAGTTSIQDAISMALGMGCCDSKASELSPQSDDQGKRDKKDSKNKEDDSDKMESADHKELGRLAHRDRNPGSGGSEDSDDLRDADDTKKKAPWK